MRMKKLHIAGKGTLIRWVQTINVNSMPGNIFIFYSLQVPRNFHSSSATADNPVPLIDDVLVYNAVPKCGSTTMTRLFTILSKKNGFNFEKMLSWRGFSDPKWSIKTQVRHHWAQKVYSFLSWQNMFFSKGWSRVCCSIRARLQCRNTCIFWISLKRENTTKEGRYTSTSLETQCVRNLCFDHVQNFV